MKLLCHALCLIVIPLSVFAECNTAQNCTANGVSWLGAPGNREATMTVAEGNRVEYLLPFSSTADSYVMFGPRYSTFDRQAHKLIWPIRFASRRTNKIYFRAYDAQCRCVQLTLTVNTIDRSPNFTRAPVKMMSRGQFVKPIAPDGIPHFPEAGVDLLDFVRQKGFSFVGSLAYGVDLDRNPRSTSAALSTLNSFLDRAHANGVKVLLKLHQADIIARISDHPAVIAFMLPDEPDLGVERDSSYYSPSRYQKLYQSIKEVTKLPVIVNFSPKWIGIPIGPKSEFAPTLLEYREWAQAADIVSFDYYPINNGVTNAADYISMMKGAVEEARILFPGKPILAYIEAVKYGLNQPASQQNTPITALEIRNQLHAVFKGGAAGVLLYGANMNKRFDVTNDVTLKGITNE